MNATYFYLNSFSAESFRIITVRFMGTEARIKPWRLNKFSLLSYKMANVSQPVSSIKFVKAWTIIS